MNAGKTLFAQVIEFVRRKTFGRSCDALAQRRIARPRVLQAQEPSVLGLDASVYALDAATGDLMDRGCLGQRDDRVICDQPHLRVRRLEPIDPVRHLTGHY
ncbi:MAG: hypothetical protein KJZ83_02400 [Burkholderiaceae bacterium]|nr:hypothetical protein [Burkholderiaceae bacterium]